MQWIAALAALMQIFAWSAPASAQSSVGHRTVVTTSWVEEWDPAVQRWVRVDEIEARAETAAPPSATISANRFAATDGSRPALAALAQYGPFLVMDPQRATMVGSTDGASPAHFDAMMRDYPELTTLEMVEAPGTSHDIANLAVGRRIREKGLNTHVPHNGSVRSGAVELFLAGANRSVEPGAQFAVHSWLDNYGRQPQDFAPDDPANRLYLDYYMEMGMSEARARAFYAMTNSVPHNSAKWLQGDDMIRWVRPELVESPGPVVDLAKGAYPKTQSQPLVASNPTIGYTDVTGATLARFSGSFAKPFLDS